MDKSKIVLIIAAVVVVISLGIAAFSIVTLTSTLNSINNPEANKVEEESTTIPMAERDKFVLSEAIIKQYTKLDSDGNKRTLSVSLELGVSINKNVKGYEDLILLMIDNEGLIRDRISNILTNKSYDFMNTPESEKILKAEILEMLQVEFDNEAIIEVYYSNYISSTK